MKKTAKALITSAVVGLTLGTIISIHMGLVQNPVEISCDIAGYDVKMQNIKEYTDVDLYSRVKKGMSVVPSEVLDMYYTDGYKIHTSSTAFVREFNTVVGKAVYRNGEFKGIYLNSDTENYDVMTLPHELGHYLDTKLGTVSDSEEWQEITAKEAGSCYECDLKNPYYMGINKNNDERYYDHEFYFECPHEFFAEQFAVYCFRTYGTGELPVEVYWDSEFCPEAQKYIESLMNNL